jgi:hypothetical protein
MKKMILAGTLSLATSAILIGCGSNGTQTASDASLETGYFIDAPVEGLSYETASGVKGVTDKYGRFQYKKGEKVRFAIGKLALGEAIPDQEGVVTPESIAQDDTALKIYLLRVLQALDSDNDPSNGITIPADVVQALEAISADMTLSDIKSDDALLKVDPKLAEVLDEDYDGQIDVDETTATNHFEESIAQWQSGQMYDDSTYNQMPGSGSQNGSHGDSHTGGGDLSAYPVYPLTNDQKYALAYMWNEEKLAKDIYLALNEIYPSNQFYNIATRSETQHEAAVEGLVQKYDINITNLKDYTVNYSEAELRALPAGTFGVDKVQALYDALYAKGVQSKVDALQVGCMVEVTDVEDLDHFIETAEAVGAKDLEEVFAHLRAGSYSHYWAFDKALKAEGVANGCASLGAEYAKTAEEYPSSH